MRKTTRTIVLLFLLIGVGGCAAQIAAKRDSWIGHHWRDYDKRSARGECYPAGDGLVSCYLNDWTVDRNGVITGWRSNSR